MKSVFKRNIEKFENRMELKRRIGKIALAVTTVTLAGAIILTGIGGALTAFYDKLPVSVKKIELVELLFGGSGEGVDKTPPTVKAVSKNTVLYTGKNVSYRTLIDVTDDSGEECDIQFDASNVNQNKPGTYTVKYTVTDASGNVKKFELKVTVMDGTYTEEKLMALVAQKAQAAIGYTKENVGNRTKTEIVKDIYNYVKSPHKNKNEANILFNDAKSNAPSQLAQNGQKHRDGWETDWIEEAYRTLTMGRMEGDCYTYYSVSKAFFEYYGIENQGIERSPRSSESGTHYWHIVKVEEGWYYYDSTRLGGTFSDNTSNSCLITEAKLNSYVTSDKSTQFYTIDKWDGFPKISTEPVS